MGSFEQQPSRKERIQGQEMILVTSPAVQKALMETWAEKTEGNFIYHNALAMAWITQGLAEKFGSYRDAHQDEMIDVHDENSLKQVLSELENSPSVH